MKVKLELEWEFEKKEWDEAISHRKEMEENIRLVIGNDVLDAVFHLNGITYPEVRSVEVG
jgi:hypothetical protein